MHIKIFASLGLAQNIIFLMKYPAWRRYRRNHNLFTLLVRPQTWTKLPIQICPLYLPDHKWCRVYTEHLRKLSNKFSDGRRMRNKILNLKQKHRTCSNAECDRTTEYPGWPLVGLTKEQHFMRPSDSTFQKIQSTLSFNINLSLEECEISLPSIHEENWADWKVGGYPWAYKNCCVSADDHLQHGAQRGAGAKTCQSQHHWSCENSSWEYCLSWTQHHVCSIWVKALFSYVFFSGTTPSSCICLSLCRGDRKINRCRECSELSP